MEKAGTRSPVSRDMYPSTVLLSVPPDRNAPVSFAGPPAERRCHRLLHVPAGGSHRLTQPDTALGILEVPVGFFGEGASRRTVRTWPGGSRRTPFQTEAGAGTERRLR